MSTMPLERAKALRMVEKWTIGMVAGGASLPDVLDGLCRAIDALIPGVVSTVMLMDPDGTQLWPAAFPRFPAALKPVISPWPIGNGRGACGTAAFTKKRVIISDVTIDPRWPDEYRAAAVEHGLLASWSQPLIGGDGAVVGTFAMYYAEPRAPELGDLELIETVGDMALIAIQLERSQEALRRVSRRLIEVQDEERMRLARELHDDINQRLALVAMRLERAKQEPADARLRQEVGEAAGQIAGLVSDIQSLSHRLHSSKLDLLGLERAAAALCRELADQQNITIDFHAESVAREMPQEISVCVFRVLQEALQNAAKHSGSRQFQVSLRGDPSGIEVTIRDEGVGFDPEAARRRRGLGLTSMNERMKLVDGQLSIESAPGCGTLVRARVPLNSQST
jgi:signal transduction histidine kinase